MSTDDRIKRLENELESASQRIRRLESLIETIRVNANSAIGGHATILERLVDHTKYVPKGGKVLRFPRTPVDVGSEV